MEFLKIVAGLHKRFVADWWTHNASYDSGAVGALVLCAAVLGRRRRAAR